MGTWTSSTPLGLRGRGRLAACIQRAPVPSLASRHGCRPGGEPREGCLYLLPGWTAWSRASRDLTIWRLFSPSSGRRWCSTASRSVLRCSPSGCSGRASQRAARADRAGGAGGARHAGVPAGRRLRGGRWRSRCRACCSGSCWLGGRCRRGSIPARRGLRRWRPTRSTWLPWRLTGHWTWPGYNFVNDTAPNFLFTDLLSRQGMTLPAVDRLHHGRDPGGPGQPRLSGGRARPARHGAAADGRGPAGRLSPDHRRHRRRWPRWRWRSSPAAPGCDRMPAAVAGRAAAWARCCSTATGCTGRSRRCWWWR